MLYQADRSQLDSQLGVERHFLYQYFQVLTYDLVAKPDGVWRLITNLSAPEGNSVNSYIEEQFCKVKYSYLDQIFDKIYDAGHRSTIWFSN
jgi:hypothetical protein